MLTCGQNTPNDGLAKKRICGRTRTCRDLVRKIRVASRLALSVFSFCEEGSLSGILVPIGRFQLARRAIKLFNLG